MKKATSKNKRRSSLEQSILLAAVLAAVAIFGLTPRPTLPTLLPLSLQESTQNPISVNRELARLRARGIQRAQGAVDEKLPAGVRAVGEWVRRTGKAPPQNQGQLIVELRRRVSDQLIEQGRTSELLALRDLQTELFIRAALGPQERDSKSLRELGGRFEEKMKSTWLSPSGKWLVSEDELALLYRIRWTTLTALSKHDAFAPSTTELLHYHHLLLRYPLDHMRLSAGELALSREKVIRSLKRFDPEYPANFFLGISALSRGDPAMAEAKLKRFLEKRPGHALRNLTENALMLIEKNKGFRGDF